MIRFRWPETPVESLDLTGWPLLEAMVTTPRDQAELHRYLGRLAYVPELIGTGGDREVYRFEHPDGEKP